MVMYAHIKRPKAKILEIGSHHFVVYAEPLLEGLTDFDDRLLWLCLAQPHGDLIPLGMFSVKTENLTLFNDDDTGDDDGANLSYPVAHVDDSAVDKNALAVE